MYAIYALWRPACVKPVKGSQCSCDIWLGDCLRRIITTPRSKPPPVVSCL